MAAPLRMNRLLQGDVGAGKTLVAFDGAADRGRGGRAGRDDGTDRDPGAAAFRGARAAGAGGGGAAGTADGARPGGRPRDEAGGSGDGADRRFWSAPMRSFRRMWRSTTCGWRWSTNSTGSAWRSGWSLGPRAQAVDVLVMTATPIPRSLALATHGDMDVSVLDEKPAGRKPIRTAMVASDRLDEVVEHLRKAVAEGRQAYWVCPLVEESEVVDYASAEERFQSSARGLGRPGGAGAWPDAARRQGCRDGAVCGRARRWCWSRPR